MLPKQRTTKTPIGLCSCAYTYKKVSPDEALYIYKMKNHLFYRIPKPNSVHRCMYDNCMYHMMMNKKSSVFAVFQNQNGDQILF